MISYEQAKQVAITDTISDGKVYCAADAGSFYAFIIVPKDFDIDIPNQLIGSTYTAVDKRDGRIWTCRVTDSRLEGAKRLDVR